ncbi:MAG: pilin N-terminal domain-containing protein [Schleiferilactobacillus harbinensis]|uniref:pilin N-terminal domain-containing protein n=1 Tax=Schleiferilactobacillus harbinensis TaxID=304207 RepID=UPI0039E968EB
MSKQRWLRAGLLGLLSLIMLLIAGGMVQAESLDTEIVLHKRVYRDVRSPEDVWYPNDGVLIEDPNHKLLSKTSGLNGANFYVYDLSAEYQRMKKEWTPSAHGGQAFTDQAFIDLYRDKPRREALTWAEQNLKRVATIKTRTDDALNEDGIARFTVPRRTPEGNKAVYLILEDKLDPAMGLNIDMTKKTSPIVVILPMMHPVDETKLNPIHLYPKNSAYVRDPYFFKFGKQANGGEVRLAGAKFVMYQLINNQKRYLQLGEENDLGNKWLNSSDPLRDDRVDKFTSDKDGLVNMGQRFLSAGTYYFEEVATIDGYELDASAKGIKVEVPEEWRDEQGNFLPVMVNGQPLMELVSGKVPEAAMQQATPRVYNNQTTTPPTTQAKPTPVSTTPPKQGGW